MKPRSKPLLVYDGECGFCRAWIERWRRATGDEVEYAPYQEIGADFPDIPLAEFARSVFLIEPDGSWSRGAEAVYRSLACAPEGGAGLWLYRHVPAFAAASEWAYRIVADHRPTFTMLTRLLWGAHVAPPGNALTVALFLRAFGAVAVAAFVSLWTQIDGLVGSRGIYPVADLFQIVRERLGPGGGWSYPTLLWLSPTDGFLHVLCGLGTLAGAALALGLAPLASLVAIWACYLSLATPGQDFLWFQWDGLLLETAVVAMLLAPRTSRLRGASDPPPPRAALFLVRWLTFRLMFSSALVKLTSGDPTWRDLSALQFHYQTQPLPPWTAWYAHHLPPGFQSFSVVVMFVIEGLVPLLLALPRRPRFAAAGTFVFLQGLILATGNYGFFNLLALALCIPLLDDAVWPRAWRGVAPLSRRGDSHGGVALAAALLVVISLAPLAGAALRRVPQWLATGLALYRFQAPLRLVNGYGLFAVMTTERAEIVIEGSMDGRAWKPYEFRWKPGDLARRPAFTTPHMPRLDWQMWFAALGGGRPEAWFIRLCERLLQGSPTVLRLMGPNPFPGAPPRYLRATLYDYRFTDPATRRATGAWWARRPIRSFSPVLTLENGRLVPVEGSISP